MQDSSRLNSTSASEASSFSRVPLGSSVPARAAANTASSVPYSWSSRAAVLGPMPFAPGILSLASPVRAR